MKKLILIGWKDLRIAFRDRAALIFMLAAPLALTVGMGFVTGQFSGGSSSGLSAIPVALVNEDEGQLGQALVDTFLSEDLAELVQATTSTDVAAARAQLEADEIAAVVIIPAGFTDSILPNQATGQTGPLATIEVYTNPARPISSDVVQSIVASFINQVETGLVGAQVAVTQLLVTGLITPQDAPAAGLALGQRMASAGSSGQLIRLETADSGTAGSGADESDAMAFDPLAYIAPGMALLFLMYTVTYGARSLLSERDEGTLPRLMVSPTGASQVLGGKMFGIYVTGLAQMGILMLGNRFLFGLNWGNPLAVMALILAVVAGATGWGILLASFARNPSQVSSIGSAVMLLFGILGGSFVSANAFPAWLQTVRLVTPNAWALDGLTELALGGTLADTLPYVGALLLMAAVLFAIAVFNFRRHGVLDRA